LGRKQNGGYPQGVNKIPHYHEIPQTVAPRVSRLAGIFNSHSSTLADATKGWFSSARWNEYAYDSTRGSTKVQGSTAERFSSKGTPILHWSLIIIIIILSPKASTTTGIGLSSEATTTAGTKGTT